MLLTALFIITLISLFLGFCALCTTVIVHRDNKLLRGYIAEQATMMVNKCNEAINCANTAGDNTKSLSQEVERLAEVVLADVRNRASDAAFVSVLTRTPASALPQA